MSESAIGGYMAFVLFIGAAFHDAFEWQRVALRQEMNDHLEQMRSSNGKVAKEAMIDALLAVQKIMGKDWEPEGEWMQNIKSLLGGEDDAVQE